MSRKKFLFFRDLSLILNHFFHRPTVNLSGAIWPWRERTNKSLPLSRFHKKYIFHTVFILHLLHACAWACVNGQRSACSILQIKSKKRPRQIHQTKFHVFVTIESNENETQQQENQRPLTVYGKRILLNCFYSIFSDLHSLCRAAFFDTVRNWSRLRRYYGTMQTPARLVVTHFSIFSFIRQHFWSVVWWQEVYRFIHITSDWNGFCCCWRSRRWIKWVSEGTASVLLHLGSRINCVWQAEFVALPFSLMTYHEILVRP